MSRVAHAFVGLAIASAAVWDVVVGLFMLFGPSPWRGHGDGTVWVDGAARVADPVVALAFEAALRRVGAFSTFAGIVGCALLVAGWRDRRVRTAQLLVFTACGPLFLYVDHGWFAGTAYFVAKQGIGTIWALGLLVHFLGPREAPTPSGED
jgi:hypothetical protein